MARKFTIEGIPLAKLTRGMEIRHNEGKREWLRIEDISMDTYEPRSATVRLLGGRDAGEVTRISLYDYASGYTVRTDGDTFSAAYPDEV